MLTAPPLETPTIATDGDTIGDRVRRLRLARGWTQEELSHQAGVTKNQVWYLESGRTDMPQRRVLEAYAKALGVSVTFLREGRETTTAQALPPLESYLRITSELTDDQIAYVRRSVEAMEAERELAEMRAVYAVDAEGESMDAANQEEARSPTDLSQFTEAELRERFDIAAFSHPAFPPEVLRQIREEAERRMRELGLDDGDEQ